MRDLKQDYFEWMCKRVSVKRRKPSYHLLLDELNNTEFEFYIDMDSNRYDDGVDLRFRYGYECEIPFDVIAMQLDNEPCSVLEMMVALAIDCEEHIMFDPEIGDRTSYWFWNMIDSLGLKGMDDEHYNARKVRNIISRFLRRDYDPSGAGGLFTLKRPRKDMRKAEIWYQLNWYLDELIEDKVI